MKGQALRIRRRAVSAAAAMTAALAIGGGVPMVAPAAQPRSAVAASCVYGTIGGHRKCLRRGEYCARRYERQYERYGFTCSKRDRRGRWHLQ